MTPCIMQEWLPVSCKNDSCHAQKHSHLRKYSGAVFSRRGFILREGGVYCGYENMLAFSSYCRRKPPCFLWSFIVLLVFCRECFCCITPRQEYFMRKPLQSLLHNAEWVVFTHVIRKLFLVRFTTIVLPKPPRAVTLCSVLWFTWVFSSASCVLRFIELLA